MRDKSLKSVDVYAFDTHVTYGLFSNIDLQFIAGIPHLRMLIFRNVGNLREPTDEHRHRIKSLVLETLLALKTCGRRFSINTKVEEGQFDLQIFVSDTEHAQIGGPEGDEYDQIKGLAALPEYHLQEVKSKI